MRDGEDFLHRWHARRAGASHVVFGLGALGDGRTSYERLVSVAGPEPTRVLDLACGDGPLTELLLAAGHTVTALDMNEAELAAAHARVPGATFVRSRAQAMPLGDASMDVVLSHMALMLMSDAPAVISEVRRVLVPGGRLGFVVGRRAALPEPVQAAFRAWREMREAHGIPAAPRLGEPAWSHEEGVASLFDEWSVERLEDLDLHVELARSAIGPFFEHAYYGNGALADRAPDAWAAWLARQQDPTHWTFRMRLGVVRSPA